MGLKKCKACNGSGKVTYFDKEGKKVGAEAAPCKPCNGVGRVSSGKKPEEW